MQAHEANRVLTQILAQRLGCAAEDLTPETELEQLGLDSLELIEIGLELEETSGRALRPAQRLCTVGDLAQLLAQE